MSAMKVGVLLITHGRLGHELLDCARDLLGDLPLRAEMLEVPRVAGHEALLERGRQMIARLDQGFGVLLLTDAYGATPSNVANKLGLEHRLPVVSGVNLPMLVRVFNYPHSRIAEIAVLAVEGGQRGIMLCPSTPSA